MLAKPLLAALLAVALPGGVANPVFATDRGAVARRAASFIVARQTSAGAFFSAGAPADGVAEQIVAVVAGDVRGPVIERALGYLRRHGPARSSERGAYAGRIVIALVAAGRDPRAFGGVDYVARLRGFFNPLTGSYDSIPPSRGRASLYADALAILGLLAAKERVEAAALDRFRLHRCSDGGFGHEEGCVGGADVDTTAAVVSALAAAKGSDDLRDGARAWLAAARNPDGGFGYARGAATNANSTALAITAIATLGEDPAHAPWTSGGAGPLTALLRLQRGDGGFRYDAARDVSDGYATVQAVPAVAGIAHPVSHVRASHAASRTSAPRSGSSGAPSGGVPAVPSSVASPNRAPAPAVSHPPEAAAGAHSTVAPAPPATGRAGPLAGATAAWLAVAGAFAFARRSGRRA